MLDHLFVSQSTNYRWILGHWIREIEGRIPGKSKTWWLPTSFSKNNLHSRVLRKIPLPKSRSYYFTFPTIFENYLKISPSSVEDKSIVLYTHYEISLGDNSRQVEVLNQAKKVHFMCSHDQNRLILAGLPEEKCRLVLGAVDNECYWEETSRRIPKSILLSSRYGPRKGSQLLLEIVRLMPDWRFTILGKGWAEFLSHNQTSKLTNLEYLEWSVTSRRMLMSESEVFLSVSSLEGGPIPLLEALSCGMYCIALDVGFARDVITDSKIGKVLPLNSTAESIRDSITAAELNPVASAMSTQYLTWDQMAKNYLRDANSKF